MEMEQLIIRTLLIREGWGYHMGHFLVDQRYATSANCQTEQIHTYCPNGINHPHIDVLENFDPNLSTDDDPFRWIPKGLMQDLMDNTPGEIFPVTDNVNGFTIQQLFNAMQSDVNSIQQYRGRLIQQNPGNQTNAITNLFGQYHY